MSIFSFTAAKIAANTESGLVRILPLLCMTTLAIGFAVVGVARTGAVAGSVPKELTSSPISSPNETTSLPQTQQVSTALITIRPSGFDPSELELPGGQFRLAVDNRSGLDELTLRLTREGGPLVREDHLSPESPRVREKIELPAGTYWLTETGHEQWRCRIVIGS